MSMTATARRVGDGLRHDVEVNGRHTIVTDEPESLGGTDVGPAPHELLPATLASCISTMIALYATRHDWRLEGLSVEVDYDPELTPRHFDIRVHLPAGLSADHVARLRRVAATCPVRRALEGVFVFDERVVIADRYRSPSVVT
jgi:putative redox protein